VIHPRVGRIDDVRSTSSHALTVQARSTASAKRRSFAGIKVDGIVPVLDWDVPHITPVNSARTYVEST